MGPLKIGKAVHRVLEEVGTGVLVGRDFAPADWRECFDDSAAIFRLDVDEYEQGWKVLAGVVANDRFQAHLRRAIAVEEPFDLDVDGRQIVGIFDRVDYDPATETWYVVDYKSGEYIPTRAEVRNDLQFGLYLAKLRRQLGPDAKIMAVAWFLARDVRMEIEWDAEVEAATLARIRGFLRATEGHVWPEDEWRAAARTSAECLRCESKGRCPAYARELAAKAVTAQIDAASDEELLKERLRAATLAKFFEDHKSACDVAIKARLWDRPEIRAGGVRARWVSRQRKRLPDLGTVAREAGATLAALGAVNPDLPTLIFDEVAGLDERALDRWVSKLKPDEQVAVWRRLEELTEVFDCSQYVDVRATKEV